MNYNDIKKFFDDWGSFISLLLSPIFAWFFTRDKQKIENKKLSAEKDSVVVESATKLINQWEKFYSEIKKDYHDLQTTNNNYTKQIDALLKRLTELEIKLNSLETYTKNLQTYTRELEEYTFEIKEAVEILILEIEKTNPTFAIEKRAKIKEALRKLEDAKKPTTTEY
jgi:chromosome segregation ATPase